MMSAPKRVTLSPEEWEREFQYRCAMMLAQSLYDDYILTEEDLDEIDTAFREKYRPLLAII